MTLQAKGCICIPMSPKKKALRETADAIADGCLMSRVRLLHRTITSIYDDALRPLGLTAGQLNILVMIAKCGPVAPGVIARRLNMEKSTVSRNVARMCNNGWLTVSTGDTGREQRLTLNATGEALLLEARPLWDEAQIRAKAVIGPGGAESIVSLGDSVLGHIARE